MRRLKLFRRYPLAKMYLRFDQPCFAEKLFPFCERRQRLGTMAQFLGALFEFDDGGGLFHSSRILPLPASGRP